MIQFHFHKILKMTEIQRYHIDCIHWDCEKRNCLQRGKIKLFWVMEIFYVLIVVATLYTMGYICPN